VFSVPYELVKLKLMSVAAPLMEIFNKMMYLINSGIGRDKCCRIIQYFIMAIMPVL
jgi:hypothetical protein